jgi:uncharacterized membrane protein
MKKELRSKKDIVRQAAISGFIFAIVMAIFDFFSEAPFSFLKFIVHFLVYGLIMGFLFRYKRTKQSS